MPCVLLQLVCVVAIAVSVDGSLLPYEVNDDVVSEYTLPDLPYDYNGLEPYLDEATLRVHHTGHHAGYTKKLNAVLKQWREENPNQELASDSILSILENLGKVPEQHRRTVTNVGGGFVNHNLYFSVMSPLSSNDSRVPVGEVSDLIIKFFGSYKAFNDLFTSRAMSVFGSGYVWLCQRETTDSRGISTLELSVTSTGNQDAPMTDQLQPILTLDLWEHAYYLKHQNKRAKYIEDWWNVVNWDAVQGLSEWWIKRAPSAHDEL
ncbi:superoxide dismutase [Mn]-like [Amphiura filiformis]|uniref:superoxide dismutase [Mn]-like n=1 Tax=Amphiura filiformis TaxID=82378 RepID=UPI003B215999